MDLPIHLPPSLTLLAAALAVCIGLLAYRQPLALAWAMWRHKRRWPQSLQVECLRVALLSDNRWLASDPTARALTDRYLAMLADDWMSVSHEDTAQMRQRLDLDPYRAEPKVRRALAILEDAGATNISFDYPAPSPKGYYGNVPTATEATPFPEMTTFSVLVRDAQRRASVAKSNENEGDTP